MKLIAIILGLLTLLVIITMGAYAFIPDVADPALSKLEALFLSTDFSGEASFINVSIDLSDLKGVIGNIAENATPSFNLNVILIIVGIFLMLTAFSHRWWCTIVQLFFIPASGFLAAQVVESFKVLADSSSTSWGAAGSCFWPLMVVFIVLFICAFINVYHTFRKDSDGESFGTFLVGLIISAIVAFIFSLLCAGVTLLLLGTGWAGVIWIIFTIAAIISLLITVLTLLLDD